MKESTYRKAMIILLSINAILQSVIIWVTGKHKIIATLDTWKLLWLIINNTWFSGICCSLIAVLILYNRQVWYSKLKIKEDLRCDEVIRDVYKGLRHYNQFLKYIPTIDEKSSDIEHIANTYADFYKSYSIELEIINSILTYENNNILLDSVQSCFFINLNFKLLGIMNNIKNRLPNLKSRPEKIEILYSQYKGNPSYELQIKFSSEIKVYLFDLKFMVEYWGSLLDYLKYNPTYIDLFEEIYESKYDITEDIKGPKEILNNHLLDAKKEAKRIYFRQKIFFWTKYFKPRNK